MNLTDYLNEYAKRSYQPVSTDLSVKHLKQFMFLSREFLTIFSPTTLYVDVPFYHFSNPQKGIASIDYIFQNHGRDILLVQIQASKVVSQHGKYLKKIKRNKQSLLRAHHYLQEHFDIPEIYEILFRKKSQTLEFLF